MGFTVTYISILFLFFPTGKPTLVPPIYNKAIQPFLYGRGRSIDRYFACCLQVRVGLIEKVESFPKGLEL